MRILLLGPCSPQDLSEYFYQADSLRAQNYFGYRGIPVSSLASSLLERGHSVIIISTAKRECNDIVVFQGSRIRMKVIEYHSRPIWNALTFFHGIRRRIIREIIKEEFEVLNAHWTYEFALAGLSYRQSTIVTVHDAPINVFRYHKDIYRFFRLLLSIWVRLKAKNCVFVSSYLLTSWRKHMKWNRNSIIIPNMTPFEVLNPSALIKQSRRDNLKILAIGDGTELKNFKSLLIAWMRVVKIFPRCELVLVGPGLEIGSELHEWCGFFLGSGQGIQSITWMGYRQREEIRQLFIESDILINPSLEESQSIVLIEAMSLGVPVIAGDSSGGTSETVKNSGLLINVNDPKVIAEAICNLIEDPGKRYLMALQGLEIVRKFYLPNKIIQEYLEVYSNSIAEQK